NAVAGAANVAISQMAATDIRTFIRGSGALAGGPSAGGSRGDPRAGQPSGNPSQDAEDADGNADVGQGAGAGRVRLGGLERGAALGWIGQRHRELQRRLQLDFVEFAIGSIEGLIDRVAVDSARENPLVVAVARGQDV